MLLGQSEVFTVHDGRKQRKHASLQAGKRLKVSYRSQSVVMGNGGNGGAKDHEPGT